MGERQRGSKASASCLRPQRGPSCKLSRPASLAVLQAQSSGGPTPRITSCASESRIATSAKAQHNCPSRVRRSRSFCSRPPTPHVCGWDPPYKARSRRGAARRRRGFYCADDAATGRRDDCFPETYGLIAAPTDCDGGGGGGTQTAALLPLIVTLPVLAALLLLAAAAAWDSGWRHEDDSDRILRAEMAALRARLGIRQEDGYVLHTDRPIPWWRRGAGAAAARGIVFLQRSGVEAAARLGLWQVRHLPAATATPFACVERGTGAARFGGPDAGGHGHLCSRAWGTGRACRRLRLMFSAGAAPWFGGRAGL